MTQTESHEAAPKADGAGAQGPKQGEWGPEEQRRAFIRLAVIVAVAAVGSVAAGIGKTMLVVLAFIVMIMLHELGHFVMAKLAGMKVTEYFLGFGPRLWSVRKGETEYGVKAIPLGGYVKIIGMSNLEEVPPEDEARTYRQKGYWRRLSVAVAGSTVHFIIAFMLLVGIVAFIGTPDPHPPAVIDTISRLETGPSPAEEAGFQVGDRIVAVDGTPIKEWDELPAYIRARPGEAIAFDVVRGSERLKLTATPVDLSKVKVRDMPVVTEPRGFIGIGGELDPVVKTSGIGAVGKAGSELKRFTGETFKALGKMFSASGMGDYADELSGKANGDGSNRFLSPVGFVRIAGQAADSGLRYVLILLVAINIFVGLFNMIPLLPFDGGHVAIATYEAIRSRKGRRYFVDGRKAVAAAYPVVVVLIFIAVSSLYIDVMRPLSNPFR
jgi:membrane-associated protease RseP (regulator of RpoE activity)